MTADKDWNGRERRAADIQTFQLVAETHAKVEEHRQTVAEKIDDVKDELDALRVRQDAQFKELKNELVQLQHSMQSYMEKTPDAIKEKIEELIDEAFPEDPDFPDASPSEKRKLHRRYHAKLIAKAIDDMERKQTFMDKLYAHVAQNALNLIGLALLAYFGLSR